jgi:hypothetical protein
MKEKELYESLIEADQLKGFSGDWEKDKNKFLKELEKMANIIEVNEE